MKKCKYCAHTNRDIARFCKYCGHSLEESEAPLIRDTGSSPLGDLPSSPLDVLIDKEDIKQKLTQLVCQAKKIAQFDRQLEKRMALNLAIIGDSGTGKHTIAKAFTTALFQAGLTDKPVPTFVSAIKYEAFTKDLDASIKDIGNGVLVIEEAEKLVTDGQATSVEQIDYILKPSKEWREIPTKPILIYLGQKRLGNYLFSNPDAAACIDYQIETHEITLNGMLEIARQLITETYHQVITEEALQKLRRIFNNDIRNPKKALGKNGHNAYKRAYQAHLKAAGEPITPDMIEGEEFVPKTLEEIMHEFDRYVGMEDVKSQIQSIANQLEEERLKHGEDAPIQITSHYLFLGNPGTGKTTMARLFADALNALGVLATGQLVEVSRNDLISNYVGDTAKQVTKCFDKAMGGVLFIDEAYSLKNSENDNVGQEAVDTIIQLVENRRGNVIVILAGYSKEMHKFLQSNSGMPSRFKKEVTFRDFTGSELAEIFRRMVLHSNKYSLSKEADKHIDQFFEKMYLTRTPQFGNAREVRTVYERAVESLTDRNKQAREDGTYNPETANVIILTDIDEDCGKPKSVEEILSSFDEFVGMSSVKDQIRKIANRVKLDRMRAMRGGKATQPNIHIIITGNPGTGKTEVAKKLGKVFKAMGVLPKGHVVVRERKTLLDSYVNSAGRNMDKAVDEAMGGILFIDEAYNLIPIGPTKDKDGVAAVEALMTRMSNDAGKFITVIAGYKTEIEEFVTNANPGLKRRFTHSIHIDDYSVENLVDIFKLTAKKEGFTISEEAEQLLFKKIAEMVAMKDKNFGNAGDIVKLVSEAKERQSNRVSEVANDDMSDEMLFTIEAEDIPYDPPKKVDIEDCMKELDQLVGLSSVKKAIRELADTLIIEQKRAEQSGERPNVNLEHCLFLGNPGTGKTTVARIMGNIFYSLGLLPSNKVVEVTSKDLIAPYVGQTALKTEQMINRSIGGIFFIDEAYSLNDGPNGFGKDATPVIITKLLEYRGKMVCIAAGYPQETMDWVKSNHGTDSRFERKILFEDYTAEELAQIFRNIVKKNHFQLEERADMEMQKYFRLLANNKGKNFANAREAHNYFNRVKINQGRRLRERMSTLGINAEDLYILKEEDMII